VLQIFVSRVEFNTKDTKDTKVGIRRPASARRSAAWKQAAMPTWKRWRPLWIT